MMLDVPPEDVPDRDVLQVEVPGEQSAYFAVLVPFESQGGQENFTITVEEKASTNGALNFDWGKTRLTTDFMVH